MNSASLASNEAPALEPLTPAEWAEAILSTVKENPDGVDS